MVIPDILSRRREYELERSLKITDLILHTFVSDVKVPRFHQKQSVTSAPDAATSAPDAVTSTPDFVTL
jgi:hypothetical protein